MGRFNNNMGGTRNAMIEEAHAEHLEDVKQAVIALEKLGAHAFGGQGHPTAESVGLISMEGMKILPEPLLALKDDLTELSLKNCADLRHLPAELERFVKLQELSLTGCTALEHPLPDLSELALQRLTVHTAGASIAVQEWSKYGFKEHTYPTGCTHGEHDHRGAHP